LLFCGKIKTDKPSIIVVSKNIQMKKLTLILCLFLTLVILFAQEKQANYSRVKIYAATQEHFNALSQKGVCLENLDFKRGVYIIGEFSDYEITKIQETQIPFEILIENMSEYYTKQNEGYSIEKLNEEMKKNPKIYKGNRSPSHFRLGSMGGYLTLAEIMEDLDEMRAEFPNLISARATFPQQTVEGRNIYWVRISNNPDIDQEKPRVLYTALTHAREPAGMHQMIYQMWDLLENYGNDPEITYYIDNMELYFVPCVNPDGYEQNRQTNPNGGGMWRKNKIGGYGVDLNRNWGYMWGYDNTGSSPYTGDETYRGASAFSEVETQALRDLCENKDFLLCLNNHTYGNYLVYPFGYINATPPEFPIYQAFAQRLTSENHYAYGNCYQLLNYYSNGGSEDWFYGEQETKNIVYALTPEAGDPGEGFWPPAYRIEEICAGHVLMNKYMMRFALPYAEIEDKSEIAFQELENSFKFELFSLGLSLNTNFTITIEPVSDNIQFVQTTPLVFENMEMLEKREGALTVVLKPNIVSGDEIIFDVCVNNGFFIHKHRFTKIFGAMVKLIDDDCETMENWSSTTWNLTNAKCVSPTHSITDSPYGNYPSNANTTIYSKNNYDLTGALAAYAEFYAQWEIEATYDYVQFLVSENNGTTWVPQPGKYTKLGGIYQDYGKPLYDGNQYSWVSETIDLSNYIGKSIKVGFRLRSDMAVNGDGFYFDDFVLGIIMPQHFPPILHFPDTISFFDTDIYYEFCILDYVYDANPEELTAQWEGNENFTITYNEDTHLMRISADDWTGCENVMFTIHNEYGESSQEVLIQCIYTEIDTVAVHDYNMNSFTAYYNATTKKIVINNVDRTTIFSLFNVEGKLIDSFNMSKNNYEVNVSRFRSGIYFLKTNFGEVQKMIIY
jgi:murein tripeptide amidase MpaA